jgi:hypothetical protein
MGSACGPGANPAAPARPRAFFFDFLMAVKEVQLN